MLPTLALSLDESTKTDAFDTLDTLDTATLKALEDALEAFDTLDTDAPASIKKTLDMIRKKNQKKDKALAREAKAKQLLEEKRQKEADRQAAKDQKEIDKVEAEERAAASKAFKEANELSKTETMTVAQAIMRLNLEFELAFAKLTALVGNRDAADPELLKDNTVALLEGERKQTVQRLEAAKEERADIERLSETYKRERASGKRIEPMSDKEKADLSARYRQLKQTIERDEALLLKHQQELPLPELLRSLVAANSRLPITTGRKLFDEVYKNAPVAKRAEDWPKVRSAYERAAEEVNQRNALKVNAASVDAVWDVAFRELASGRRAKALYERQAIDLLVEFAGPGSIRILCSSNWFFDGNFRFELRRLFEQDIRYNSNVNPPRAIVTNKTPEGGETVLKGLALELAIAKLDGTLAMKRITF